MTFATHPFSRLLAAGLALVLAGCGRAPDLIPLTQTAGGIESVALPADAVIVEVVPIAPAPGAEACLVVPAGALAAGLKVELPLTVTIPAAGPRHLWIHAKWANSCGNSVGLRLTGQPDRILGEDAVYGTWHWVRSGTIDLPGGHQTLTLFGREDGIAVDQLLLTADARFMPQGKLGGETGGAAELRRFADDFDRSPGHGLDGWEVVAGAWDIGFSFDPNRIPDQYSLQAKPASTDTAVTAAIQVAGPVWSGVRVTFCVRPSAGETFGVGVPNAARVAFDLNDSDQAQLAVGTAPPVPLDGRLRAGQWHRIVIESWHSVLAISIDGEPVLEMLALPPGRASIQLFSTGTAAFDDVEIVQIPWALDDAVTHELAWEEVSTGAAWFRPADRSCSLVGKQGGVRLASGQRRPEQAFVRLVPDSPGTAAVKTQRGALPLTSSTSPALVPLDGDGGFEVACAKAPVRISEIAVRYAIDDPLPASIIGPYDFTTAELIDPADYLDFTPEEVTAMNANPDESDVNKRRPRVFPVVARGADRSAWRIEQPAWVVRDGLLEGRQPGALVRHSQLIGTLCTFTGRIRFIAADSAATIRLYAGDTQAIEVPLAAAELPGGDWQFFRIACFSDHYVVSLAGKETRHAWQRGFGNELEMRIDRGAVHFDDLTIVCPRHLDGDHLYTFEQREPDWWREGGQWIDHAGIACVIASNWISLAAPNGRGTIWNKRRFAADLAVATTIEEYSQWHGWNARPHSHDHLPFDRVQVTLGVPDQSPAYTLEINAEDRRSTILMRDGQVVARCPQDASFPIRYLGGHAPYTPRRNHLQLIKQGARLRALVNGRQVIDWTDPDPLPVATVGFGGHDTHVNFSRLEIRELAPAD